MPDTPPDPKRDDAQDKALDALRATVTAQGTSITTLETRWTIVAAIVGFVAIVAVSAVNGMLTARDAVQATTLRIAALERAQTDAAASARERDADDRRTAEALVRLTVTVESLRAQVADLTSELRARENAPTRPAGR
jgi:uncharacterized coiled-coil protein SlyX